jgi:hypothetical protein
MAMISSFGMALRYSFDMGALADKVDAAIAAVLASGLRTADIKSEGTTSASTTEMGEAILKEPQNLRAYRATPSQSRRVDKATGSREYAPEDWPRAHQLRMEKNGGHGALRLCPPYRSFTKNARSRPGIFLIS